MKKLLLISLAAILLPACADRNQFEQAILEKMQKEQDLKDYKITPEYMTKCVHDLPAALAAPRLLVIVAALFPGDPVTPISPMSSGVAVTVLQDEAALQWMDQTIRLPLTAGKLPPPPSPVFCNTTK